MSKELRILKRVSMTIAGDDGGRQKTPIVGPCTTETKSNSRSDGPFIRTLY